MSPDRLYPRGTSSADRARILGTVLIASAMAVIALDQPAAAQSIVRGDLDGIVMEEGGGALPAVAVTAIEAGTRTSLFLETDRQGRFQVSMLQAGEYEVLAEAPGFVPKLVRGIQLRAGQSASVTVELEAAPPPVERVDTVWAGAGANPHYDGLGGQWVSRGEIAAFPDPGMGLDGLAALSSLMDESLGSEGLPGTSTAIYWDGLPFTPVRHPAEATAGALPILPRIGLANVDVHRRTDVEWSGGAGGYVAAISRQGSRTAGGEAYGSATTGALWQSEAFSGETVPGMTSGWGGGAVHLPLTDAQLFAGIEGLYLRTPRVSPFSTDLAERLVGVAPPIDGAQASDLSDPWLSTLRAVSGLARLDWTGGESTEVSARVGFSTLAGEGGDFFGEGLAYGSTPPFDGTDGSAAVTVLSEMNETVTLEIRAGVEYSSREWNGTAGGSEDPAVPPTFLGESEAFLGPASALPGKVTRTAVVGSPVIHFDLSEEHRIKTGFTFSIPSYEYRYVDGSRGAFYFGEPEDIESGRGLFTLTSGSSATRSFNVPEFGLVFQHLWRPRPGITVTSGIRYDQEQLPQSDVPSWANLMDATGLLNSEFAAQQDKISPRFSVALDLSGDGSTVVGGEISATYDQFDPAALNDAISLSGVVTRRQRIGELGQWPEAPEPGGDADFTGQVAAVLGPSLEAPRTARATVGISQALGTGSTLHLTGTLRRTEYLLRRSNLNLPLAPASFLEEDGRPVFGTLLKSGSIVAADPASSRRFSDFDLMWGLSADGWSDYRGFTVAFEHNSGDRLDVFAGYTFSSTEDNLVGVRTGDPLSQLSPQVEGNGSVLWEHGTSDFDVPHRLVAGLRTRFSALEGVDASAVYRFRSGWAFTAGYRPGTDVNGDGSGSNDPAFVPLDVGSAGLAEFACLNGDIGGIATRNACRGPGIHSLDVHLSIGLFRVGSSTGRLTLDLFNLLDADYGVPDTALLLVEEGQSIEQGGGQDTRVPTTVNPTFGEVIQSVRPGRMLRIGLRMGFP